MKSVDQMAKAILAAVVAGLGSLSAVLVGHTSISSVSAGQWVTIALAAVIALGAVYGVPNAKPPA